MYEYIQSPSGENVLIKTQEDGVLLSIPEEEANHDWLEFLTWCETNTPPEKPKPTTPVEPVV